MNLHQLAEARSLALHQEVARRLREDPSGIDRARSRVLEWKAEGAVHPDYIDRWLDVLDAPLEEILDLLVEQSEEANALRQVTPFAGVVDARTRWRIWRRVRDRVERQAG